MPRSIWSGAVSFGLVSVPVKLYSAVSPKTVRFHQLHAADGVRIQQRRVCPADGEEVAYEDIVKGYEIAPDRYVVVEPGELDALAPRKTRTIDIEDFVELEQIDPIYYDHPYYLVPGPGGAKPYRLLVDAMRASNKVAIARFVLRSKEQLVALRPLDGTLAMATMNFYDEVVDPSGLEELPGDEVQTTDRELAIAQQLVEVARRPVRSGALQGHLPRGRARDDRAQGRGRRDRRCADGRGGAAGCARPHERAPGQPGRGAPP